MSLKNQVGQKNCRSSASKRPNHHVKFKIKLTVLEICLKLDTATERSRLFKINIEIGCNLLKYPVQNKRRNRLCKQFIEQHVIVVRNCVSPIGLLMIPTKEPVI